MYTSTEVRYQQEFVVSFFVAFQRHHKTGDFHVFAIRSLMIGALGFICAMGLLWSTMGFFFWHHIVFRCQSSQYNSRVSPSAEKLQIRALKERVGDEKGT